MKKGKKYTASLEKVDRTKVYTLAEAVALVKETATAKFDSSVEVHMNLGIDPKQADQQLRSTVSLPHGTGKSVRVIAFVSDDKVKEAMDAGAIKAGSSELIAEIEKGWMDFDVAVAVPDMMKDLAKIARALGQAGKMPNPKAGTVSPEVTKVVKDIMKGQVEFRNDKTGNLHNTVGKASFTTEQLVENVKTYLKAVQDKKPEKMKGTFVRSLTLCSTMGPGIRVDIVDALS